MKKKLVEVGAIDPYICLDSAKFYADKTMILTPGARDELSRRGITIVYDPRPETASRLPSGQDTVEKACSPSSGAASGESHSEELERFVLAVAAMLKERYGVEDPEELKAMSFQVVKTIRENI